MRILNKLIDRRLFLQAGTSLVGVGLSRSVLGQTIERGRFDEADLPGIQNQLLKLVNDERAATGVPLLELDPLAARVAHEHALDMATGKFLSHWGRDGRKPYQRYSFAGGIDAVQENVSAAEDIQSLTPQGVARDLNDMHLAMYGEVPPNDGHRQTMLASHHTHVGFSVALDQRSLRLVELYVGRYMEINPVPRQAKPHATVVLTGRLLNPQHFLHEVEIYFEALPQPPEIAWLRAPRFYALPETYVGLRPKAPEGTFYKDGTTGDYEWSRNGKFRVPAKLATGLPGIYTIVFWVRRTPPDKAFPAAEICIRVE
jgi:uncharacterized protein YkwD